MTRKLVLEVFLEKKLQIRSWAVVDDMNTLSYTTRWKHWSEVVVGKYFFEEYYFTTLGHPRWVMYEPKDLLRLNKDWQKLYTDLKLHEL